MVADVTKTMLMKSLQKSSNQYYSKALELRDVVQKWLSYIPDTFPHYTSHSVAHSDEIISQISQMLYFPKPNSKKSAVCLSPTEIYILVASAYLHDAGMVVPDKEKMEILASKKWSDWVNTDDLKIRLDKIEMLRKDISIKEASLRQFLADRQMRFLIGEFVRKEHHFRSFSFLQEYQSDLGRFAFDDPDLQSAIADVCLSHGLSFSELETDRFPDRRNIRGELVNMRFMAILLRIGDLLDNGNDRACPLLLNAASPLPADSFAHWSKYQCIKHRLTAPDKIEITARCQNQEEHRFLHDWFSWLVQELKNAAITMIRCNLHNEWHPPKAEMTTDTCQGTITITPSDSALYIPLDWKFEFDTDMIFQRLISDIYDAPFSFVRELIQNSLDATRCQVYDDLQKQGVVLPQYPTEISEAVRNRYPIKISLFDQEITREISGSREIQQVLSIEDYGTGMTEAIIQRFLLQVGKSYYTTEEFSRKYQFQPTSQFGIGFLSVFGLSNKITLETYSPKNNGNPILLNLSGPRNYILVEKSSRSETGTKVSVVLSMRVEPSEIEKIIRYWCKRVEFPIVFKDIHHETTITSEKPEDFMNEIQEVVEPYGRYCIRSFPIHVPGKEGEIYVFSHNTLTGESWADLQYAKNKYITEHPQARIPSLPGDLESIHGITISRSVFGNDSCPISIRVDHRDNSIRPSLSRERIRHKYYQTTDRIDERIKERLIQLLSDHLQTTPLACGNEGWIYKQRLIDQIPNLEIFWDEMPHTIRGFLGGVPQLFSLNEVRSAKKIIIVASPFDNYDAKIFRVNLPEIPIPFNSFEANIPVIIEKDLHHLCNRHIVAVFTDRAITKVSLLPNSLRGVEWQRGLFMKSIKKNVGLVSFKSPNILGADLHRAIDTVYSQIVLNDTNQLVNWLVKLKNACEAQKFGLSSQQFSHVAHLFEDTIRYNKYTDLLKHLENWKGFEELSDELDRLQIGSIDDRLCVLGKPVKILGKGLHMMRKEFFKNM